MWNNAYLEEPRTSFCPVLCCLLCFRPESVLLSTLWLTTSLIRATLCIRTRVDAQTCQRPVFSSSSTTFQATPSRRASPERDSQPRLCPRKALLTVAEPSKLTSPEADSLTSGQMTSTTELLQSTSPLCHLQGRFLDPLGLAQQSCREVITLDG